MRALCREREDCFDNEQDKLLAIVKETPLTEPGWYEALTAERRSFDRVQNERHDGPSAVPLPRLSIGPPDGIYSNQDASSNSFAVNAVNYSSSGTVHLPPRRP